MVTDNELYNASKELNDAFKGKIEILEKEINAKDEYIDLLEKQIQSYKEFKEGVDKMFQDKKF